ncbi:MAG TPA: response regulator transcription factor [Alphaproteobacteria bacterium]|jgi:DNA-binding NarL/FixJ family response regulator
MDRIRIVVVDDHPMFREGVIHTLAAQEDMVVVAEGATAEDAVRLAACNLPDVLLLDLNLDGDAMKAVERITAESPSVNVLMLTVVADEECVSAAMRRGARGYILKGVSGSELAGSVRTVSQGELCLSPALAAHLLRRLYLRPDEKGFQANRFSQLTEREQQILTLLSQALSNKEIALRIKLTEKTVKHYLTSILKKLHVKNRVEAALLASHRASVPAAGRHVGASSLHEEYPRE